LLKKSLRVSKRSPGIILTILLFGLLAYFLGWSTLLSARAVVIEGTSRTAEINSAIFSGASPLKIGSPLARVDTHTLNRKVSNLDWVADESVKRDWLHGTIRIRVVERDPIAQFRSSSGKTEFIDADGIIFAGKANSTVPTISVGGKSESETLMLKELAVFIQELPADLISNLESLSIRSRDFIQSRHTGIGAGHLYIRWGSNQEMTVKVKVLRALLALSENAEAKLIDLTDPLSPIAK
jgi:cell division septal protein FtsQ